MISLTEFVLSGKNKQTQMIIDSNTEIYKLQQKIDKAIEYIKINSLYDVSYSDDVLTIVSNRKELLEILKGEDKE